MPLNMLIADADGELCEVFGGFFARRGYNVAAVEDGMACIAALQAPDAPDVLVLDWQLPWSVDDKALDWHGNLEWLRRENLAEVAVVVTTTSEPAGMSPIMPTLSHAPWLRKPFRLAELLQAIQAATRQESASRGRADSDSEAVGEHHVRRRGGVPKAEAVRGAARPHRQWCK